MIITLSRAGKAILFATVILFCASHANAEEPSGKQRIHLEISGVVQGVGFRDFTQRAGRQLGVVGWVRNLPGGSVELVAEGKDDALAEFQKKIRKGPPGARVDGIKTLKVDEAEILKDFEIKISPEK